MPVAAWFRRWLRQKPLPTVGTEAITSATTPVVAPETSTAVHPLPPLADLETPPPKLRQHRPALETPVAPTLCCTFGAGMTYGWVTDVGRVRDHNEDSVYVFVAEQYSHASTLPFGLFILADGMGGHHAGEVASALACQTVAAQLMEHVYLPLLYGDDGIVEDEESTIPLLRETLVAAIQSANQEVCASTPGSGSTLTCAMTVGRYLLIGHVGDSRAYLRQGDGAVQLLTDDHSMVKQLVDIGQLTPEQAAVHLRRNVLYRAVGQGGQLAVDVQALRLDHEAQLLLCTDGLWGSVPEETLWETITAAPSAQVACARLVATANGAGGHDNITAIVVQFQRNHTMRADEDDNLG